MNNSEPVNVLVIVGAGFMGQGIARAALTAGFSSIVLHDKDAALLERAHAGILESLKAIRSSSEAGTMPSVEILKEQGLAAAVKKADFVIEAVPEVMELKQDIFRAMARHAPPHCIFATNTSTMSIDEIAQFSEAKERVIGMHFFVPEESRLIEITKGSHTSDLTLGKTLSVGDRLPCKNGTRMTVVLDRWSPGFVVNRSTAPIVAYLNWIIDHAEEKGYKPHHIDGQMEPYIPGFYKTMDFVGLDVVHRTCISFADKLSPDLGPGRVLSDLVHKGHLGKKTGKGFYQYLHTGEPVSENGLQGKIPEEILIDLELIMAIQFNECCRIVEEGVLPDFSRIDEYIFGAISSPGPCAAGFDLHKKWCALLDELSLKTGKPYFRPCDLMKSGNFKR